MLSLVTVKKYPRSARSSCRRRRGAQPTCAGVRAEPDPRFRTFVDNWLEYNRGLGAMKGWITSAWSWSGSRPGTSRRDHVLIRFFRKTTSGKPYDARPSPRPGTSRPGRVLAPRTILPRLAPCPLTPPRRWASSCSTPGSSALPAMSGTRRAGPFRSCSRSCARRHRAAGRRGAGRRLADAFVAAGEALRARGAVGVITSCGFLAARQRALAARMSLPLATSSLMQLPLIDRCLPAAKRAGVVTYDADALTPAHFVEVGADPATPVVGLPANGGAARPDRAGGGLRRDRPRPRRPGGRGRADRAGRRRRRRDGMHQLPPFSRAVAEAFGVPVFDVITLGRWFHSGLTQTRYP